MEMYKNNFQPMKYLNLLAFIGTVAVNALANIIPFNGITTGAVSDNYRNLFAPAGVTFSIWGVIYLGLALFAIYQMGFSSSSKRTAAYLVKDIGSLFLISCIANMAWIYFWHFDEIALTLLFMLVLLFSILGIYLKLIDSKHERMDITLLFVDLPFRIYLGWISVALIANVTAFLISIDWNGFGLAPEFWTIIVIAVATLLGIIFLAKFRDYAYSLVLIWAFTGIIIQHQGFWKNEYPMVIAAAGVGIVLLILYGTLVILKRAPGTKKRRY